MTVAVFALQQDSGKPDSQTNDSVVALVDHRTDTISTALFDRGSVVGHLTTRVHFQLRKDVELLIPVPLELLIEDALFEITFNMKADELIKLKKNNLKSLAWRLEQTLNQRKTPLAVENLRFENTRLMLKST